MSKIGIFGLDDTIITFIARAEAAGDRARSRALFRLAVFLGVLQCAILAVISITVVRLFGDRVGLDPQMVAALSVMLCAMPSGRLVSHQHRCVARHESNAARHLLARHHRNDRDHPRIPGCAWASDSRTFAPEIAVIVGMGASGLVALLSGVVALSFGADASGRYFPTAQESRRLLGLRRADLRLRFA